MTSLPRLLKSDGFTYDEEANVYTQAVEYCDGSDATHAMRQYTRGRYLLTVEGNIADTSLTTSAA